MRQVVVREKRGVRCRLALPGDGAILPDAAENGAAVRAFRDLDSHEKTESARSLSRVPAARQVARTSRDYRLTRPSALVYSNVATELKLYSREWCSWCIDAKDYLTERGYKFTEVDVGVDREAYAEMTELSDQTCVPTLAAGDEVLANFDTDQLEKFLREHQIEP